jgi:hypothetical protein
MLLALLVFALTQQKWLQSLGFKPGFDQIGGLYEQKDGIMS